MSFCVLGCVHIKFFRYPGPEHTWLLSWWNQESKAEGTLNYATDPKAGWLDIWYHADETISQTHRDRVAKSVMQRIGAGNRPKTPQEFKFANDSVDLCRISRLNDVARVEQKGCWEIETTGVNMRQHFTHIAQLFSEMMSESSNL